MPNWFFYWKQIKEGVAGGGDQKFEFRPSTAQEAESFHRILYGGNPIQIVNSEIAIAQKDAISLSAYIGILAHEQSHENDFWNVIWGGGGYKADDDRDKDTLKDDWERMQVMQQSGPWTFDVPAYNGQPAVAGTKAADDTDIAFETTATVYSWGDDRADIAAKNAVDADLGIDAKDWSDQKVPAGEVHEFEDDNPPKPPRPSHKQTCKPTTKGNNKNF